MSVIGKLQEFKPETERFSTYVERLKLYFDANGVSEDKKVAVFLTVIGPKNYALLSDFYAPTKPRDIALEDLIKTLEGHFEPTPIIKAERSISIRETNVLVKALQILLLNSDGWLLIANLAPIWKKPYEIVLFVV